MRGLTSNSLAAASSPISSINWSRFMSLRLLHVSCKTQGLFLHEKLNDRYTVRRDNQTMDLKEEIGRRIKQAREDAGLTLLELSKRVGHLKVSRISNYEQGRRTPGPEEARALARALGVSAAYLLCVDAESELRPDEKALLENYRATDSRGRSTIIRIAESQPVHEIDRDTGRKKAL